MPIRLSSSHNSPGVVRNIDFKSFTFPGGEVSVKLAEHSSTPDGIWITANILSSDDVMTLLMATDALKRAHPGIPIHLTMPYLPYARQDRVCDRGESLSIKVFCDLINAQEYEEVEIWDCHSDVGVALLNNVVNVEMHNLITRNVIGNSDNTILVSPDAGAQKKTYKVAQEFGLRQIVKADKVRNPKNGEILGTTINLLPNADCGTQDFLIVDDICDGGRTFIELAKVLRPHTKGLIKLYVTHGIFSKGLEVFDGLIDEVYTANPFDTQLARLQNLIIRKD